MQLLACRACGAPIDAGPKAGLGPRVLIDAACSRCGKRALYSAQA